MSEETTTTTKQRVGVNAKRLTVGEIRDLPAMLTVEEAARLLGVTERQVKNLYHAGKIEVTYLGRYVRIPATRLLRQYGML